MMPNHFFKELSQEHHIYFDTFTVTNLWNVISDLVMSADKDDRASGNIWNVAYTKPCNNNNNNNDDDDDDK